MLNVMLKFRPAGKVLGALGFMCLMSAAAFAQSSSQVTNVEIGNYMVGYYTGANQGLPDAQLHIINPGSSGGFGASDESPSATPQGGDLCANIYVFTPDEQMIACCSCKVSPNGMQGFSLATDLTANPLTSILPHAGAIKVVASPGGGPAGNLVNHQTARVLPLPLGRRATPAHGIPLLPAAPTRLLVRADGYRSSNRGLPTCGHWERHLVLLIR